MFHIQREIVFFFSIVLHSISNEIVRWTAFSFPNRNNIFKIELTYFKLKMSIFNIILFKTRYRSLFMKRTVHLYTQPKGQCIYLLTLSPPGFLISPHLDIYFFPSCFLLSFLLLRHSTLLLRHCM